MMPTREPTFAPSAHPSAPPTEDPKIKVLEQQVALMAKADKEMAQAAKARAKARARPWSQWLLTSITSEAKQTPNGGGEGSSSTMMGLILIAILVNTCATMMSCFRGNVAIASLDVEDKSELEETRYLVPATIPRSHPPSARQSYSVPSPRYPSQRGPSHQHSPHHQHRFHGHGPSIEELPPNDALTVWSPSQQPPPPDDEGFGGFEA